MAEAEEFEIVIEPDGQVRMDLRGVSAESYRRIVDLLRETVGHVQEIEVGDATPPPVVRTAAEDESAQEETELRRG